MKADTAVPLHPHGEDMLAWSLERAGLLRAHRFDRLDIEHLADEIEDLGKSEQRELASRMTVLIAHLAKWQYQPDRRGKSWALTIREQRRQVALKLRKEPGLTPLLADPDWHRGVWADAVRDAHRDTGFDDFPDACPWSFPQVLDEDFWRSA